MDYSEKVITDIELHSVEGLRECFENGVRPNDTHRGKPLIYELIGEYKRGSSFSDCVRIFIEYGLEFDDKILLAILSDNHVSLEKILKENPSAIHKKYSLDCAFTPLYEASLLHICAEFNHLECAKILIRHGINVDEKAGIDVHGFGGQTPIFHTVNQHNHVCMETMKYLISQSASLHHTVKGLIWGKGYEWETFIPSVNPVSYAMMGLLNQFQRTEKDIYEVVGILLKAAYGIEYKPQNIPNKYLNK